MGGGCCELPPARELLLPPPSCRLPRCCPVSRGTGADGSPGRCAGGGAVLNRSSHHEGPGAEAGMWLTWGNGFLWGLHAPDKPLSQGRGPPVMAAVCETGHRQGLRSRRRTGAEHPAGLSSSRPRWATLLLFLQTQGRESGRHCWAEPSRPAPSARSHNVAASESHALDNLSRCRALLNQGCPGRLRFAVGTPCSRFRLWSLQPALCLPLQRGVAFSRTSLESREPRSPGPGVARPGQRGRAPGSSQAQVRTGRRFLCPHHFLRGRRMPDASRRGPLCASQPFIPSCN